MKNLFQLLTSHRAEPSAKRRNATMQGLTPFNATMQGLTPFLTLGVVALLGYGTDAFAWSWPSCRNYNGGSPEQSPATIYLGDTATFGHDSWAQLDAKWAKWIVAIRQGNSDVSGGTFGSEYGPAGDKEHKQAESPRFTATGTWYWGMKVWYPDAGNTTAWYCNNNSSWANMYGTPPGSTPITCTVTALTDPTVGTLTPATTDITLNWTQWNSKDVLIVRKLTSESWTEPTQGTAYISGSIGQGVVVYNGSGTSYQNTGLTAGTTYDYKFYSVNNNYYSAGATGQATTTLAAPTSDSSNPSFSNERQTQVNLGWTKGNGARRIVVAKASTISGEPVDGTDYSTATADFSSTSQSLSDGSKVVYDGTGESFTMTGLSENTRYYVKVFEYNGTGTSTKYYTGGTPGNSDGYTLGNPTSPGSSAHGTYPATAVTLTWTESRSKNVLVARTTVASPTGTPTPGTGYSANQTFGDWTVVAGSDDDGTVDATGLQPNTTYYFGFWSENSSYYSSGTTPISRMTAIPKSRNHNDSTSPNQPATLYVGDTGTFGTKSYGEVASGSSAAGWYVRIKKANGALSSGASEGSSGGSGNSENKTATSPTFTSSGTWYWGMRVDYNPYQSWYYLADQDGLTDMDADGDTATLTVTVTALNDPSYSSNTKNSSSITLNWSKDAQSHNVMIVRSTDSSFTAPTEDTPYTAGSTIGGDLVIYNGSGISATDSSLSSCTTYYYKFYSENHSYYSSGVTSGGITTDTAAPTTYSWRAEALNNRWNDGSNIQWWNSTTVAAGALGANGIIYVNNNVYSGAWDQNASNPQSVHQLVYASAATDARTLSGNALAFTDNCGTDPVIQNDSAATHVINVAITGDATDPLSINAVSGNLTFGGNINNNGQALNIDVASGKTVTLQTGVVSGNGGLAKTSTGQLTISGMETYSGATTVGAGTLLVSGSIGYSAVTVSSGATLAGAGTLTVSGAAALGGGIYTCDITGTGSTACDLIDATGAVAAGSTLTINLPASMPSGVTDSGSYSWTIMSSSISASAANMVLGTHWTASGTFGVSASGNTIVVTYTPPTPTISSTGTPAALETTVGTASDNTTFSVSGTFMTAGILVTPPSTDFEVSLSSGSGFASTITVGSAGTISATTVYLRLAAGATVGIKSGNIVLSSSGATSVNVATASSKVRPISAVWDGGGADANTKTELNWDQNLYPGLGTSSTLSFAGTTSTTVENTFDNASTVNAIQFTSGAASFTLQDTGNDNAMTLGGTTPTIVNNDDSLQTINVNFTLGAATTLNAASGNLTLGGTLANGGFLLTAQSPTSRTLALSGAISGSGGLTKTGAGTLTLTGDNTFVGGVSQSPTGGRINIGHANALGSGTYTIASGSQFDATGGSRTIANALAINAATTFVGSNPLTINGGVNLGATNRTLTITASTLTLAGIISPASRVLTKDGASGTLTLSGVNIHGGTTLTTGTLNINNAQALGASGSTFTINGGTINNTSAGPITTLDYPMTWGGNFAFTGTQNLNLGAGATTMGASRTLTVNGGVLTVGGIISGTGFKLTKAGDGALTLSGVNTFTGGSQISAGTLNINNAQALGTAAGTFTIAGGTIDNTSGSSITLLSYPITWDQSFTFSGSSDLNLGAGNTTLSSGSRTVTVNGGNLTFGGVIDSAGIARSITKAGAGALTLSGANTYSGGTTLSAGILNINHAAAIGTAKLTISGASTINNTSGGPITLSNNNTQDWNADFAFTGTGDLNMGTGVVAMGASRTVTVNGGNLTVGGVISGSSCKLTKAGAGTLTLSGVNTFTGGSEISAGTLNINNAQALGTVAGTFTIAGGTLNNTSGGAITTLNYPMAWNSDLVFTGTSDLNLGAGAVTLGGNRQVTVTAGTLTVGGVISGAYSLTKSGAGTLVLTGNNLYSGDTTISAGTLALTGSGAISSSPNIQVAASATFDVSGKASTYTLSSSTLKAPGTAGTGTILVSSTAGLTLANTGTALILPNFVSGTPSLDVNGSSAGALTLQSGGAVTVYNAGGALAAGTYKLISKSGSATGVAGTPGTVTVTGGGVGSNSAILVITNGELFLVVGVASSVTTVAGSATNTTTATVNGNVTADGGQSITDRGVVYKTSAGVTISDNKTPAAVPTGTGAFSVDLSSLSVNTLYYFKAYAINAMGTTLGSELQFCTLAATPANPILGALSTSTLSLNVQRNAANPADTELAVHEINLGKYLQADGTLGDPTVWQVEATWDATTISGLNINSQYMFKVKARNRENVETALSSTTGSKYTLANVPSAPTVNNPTTTSLDVNVNPNSNPANTTFAIYISTTDQYVQTDGTLGATAAWQTDASWGTKTVLGLTQNTEYSFQVKARNGDGTETALSGATAEFTTAATLGEWDGEGINGNWGTAANWSANTEPTSSDTATFYTGSGSGTSITLDADKSVLGVLFNSQADLALTFGGSYGLTIGTGGLGLDASSGAAHTIGNAVVLGGNQTWDNDSASDFTVSGVLSGSGTLEKTGTGRVILSGNNTYSAATTVGSGPLRIAHINALGGTGAGTTVSSGGALELNGGISTAAEPLTLSGTGVSGVGALVNQSGANTFGGAITLGADALIANDSSTLTLGSTIGIGANTLTIEANGITVASGAITGGALTKTGASRLELNGDNSGLTGTITLSEGSFRVGHNSALAGGGSLVMANGTKIEASTTADRTLTKDLTLNGNVTFGASSSQTGSLPISGTVGLGSGVRTITVDNPSGKYTEFQGVVSSGGISKAGDGLLILSGNNVYASGTTISAGTLQIGAGGTSGTVEGNIANNAALIFNRSDPLSYAGVISGTGTLTQNGSGVLTLSGNSDFSGATTISGGTIQMGHANALGTTAAGTTVGNGFTLDLNGQTVLAEPVSIIGTGIGTAGALVNNSGTASLSGPITLAGAASIGGSGGATLSGAITGTAGLTKVGAGTITLSGNNAATLTTSGSTITVSAGTLRVGHVGALGDILAGTTVSATGGALDLNGVAVGAEPVGLTGTGVSTGGALLNSSATAASLSGPITLNAASTITSSGSGGLTLSGGITLGANTVTFAGDNATTVSTAKITGSGAVTKTDLGTLTLSAANDYTGLTTVSGGTLKLGHATALGTIDAGTVVGSGFTLDLNGQAVANAEAVSIAGTGIGGIGALVDNAGSGSLAGNVTLTAAATVGGSGSWALGGTLNGAFNLTKVGDGTITLNGNSTAYANSITINGGILKLGHAGALGTTAAGTVVSSGFTLDMNGQAVGAEGVTLSGSGIGSAGALINSSANVASLSGAITVSADSMIGVPAGAGELTLSGQINESTGAFNMTKVGTGTLTLSGNNLVDGAWYVNAGTVKLGSATGLGNVGSGKQTEVASGAVVDVNGQAVGNELFTLNGTGIGLAGALINNSTAASMGSSGVITLGSDSSIGGTGDITFSGTFAGAYTLTKVGAGTHTLAGASTSWDNHKIVITAGTLAFQTGETRLGAVPATVVADQITVNGGTLLLSGASNQELSANRGVTLGASGGTLSADASRTLTVNSIIAGAGTLAKAGDGIVILSGDNTYGGATTVSAGTLRLGAADRIPNASAVTVSSGATLDLNGNSDVVGSLAGAGAVTLGAGTLTAGGNNTSTAFSGTMTGTGGLAKNGNGTLTISTSLAYTGITTINAGTLALADLGAIASSKPIILGTNATLAVSGLTTALTLATGQGITVIASASGSPAILATASGKGVTTAANSPIVLGSYSSVGGAPLQVTGAGSLTLASGNSVIVTNTGTALAEGTYKIIAKDGSSSVAGVAPGTVNVVGNGIAASHTVTAAITSGELFLVVIPNLPTAPTGLTASDGTSTTQVELSWTDVALETGFVIWRNTVNTFGTSTAIYTNAANLTTYNDTGATAGQQYYYWVTATNATGSSAASTVDGGYKKLATPASVSASDGTSTDSVTVTWGNVAGETGFAVWRSESNDSNTATVVTTTAADVLTYTDSSAAPGQQYYYWVLATNTTSASQSSWSSSNGGYRKLLTPANVVASDGSSSAHVALSWDNVVGETGFSIWRHTSDASNLASWVATVAADTLTYNDSSAAVGTLYYYWVLATNSTSVSQSDWSTVNSGFRAPPDPSLQSATADGKTMIDLAWTKDASYNVMIVYRASSASTAPTQGSAYNVGDDCGSGKVIYKGSGSTLEHVVASGTSHNYAFYSYSGNYYSPGLTATASTTAFAAGEVVETVSYTNGTTLAGLGGLNGWGGVWYGDSDFTVASGSFSSQTNYPAPSGNKIKVTPPSDGSKQIFRALGQEYKSGRIYFGYVLNYLYEGAGKYEGLSLYWGDSSEKLFIGEVSSQDQKLGIDTTASSYTLAKGSGNDYIIVGYYDWGTAEAKAKAYKIGTESVPSDEPTTWDLTVSKASNTVGTVNNIRLKAGASSGTPGDTYFDEIRISTNWAGLIQVVPSKPDNPSGQTATADGKEMVRLAWTKNGSDNGVMIVRKSSAISVDPTDGSSYSVGSTIDGATVVYKGTGTTLEHVVDAGSENYYKFYSYSSSDYYSAGLTANVTMGSYQSFENVNPFAYTNDTAFGTSMKGGQGFGANYWAVNSGTWKARTNNTLAVADTPKFASITGYPAISGNLAFLADPGNGSSAVAERDLSSTVSTGTFYVAFMMSYQFYGANKWAGLSLMDGTTEKAFFGKGSGANWNTLAAVGNLTTYWSGYNLLPFHSTGGNTGNVYIVVGKYNFESKLLQTKAWNIFSSSEFPSTEPSSWDASGTLGTGINQITRIRLNAGSSDGGNTIGRVFYDEIRYGTEWSHLVATLCPTWAGSNTLNNAAWTIPATNYLGETMAFQFQSSPSGAGQTAQLEFDWARDGAFSSTNAMTWWKNENNNSYWTNQVKLTAVGTFTSRYVAAASACGATRTNNQRFVVSNLVPPSAATATIDGVNTNSQINLVWTRGVSGVEKDTLIIRRSVNAPDQDPVNGQTYNLGDSIGNATVVYKGSGTTFSDSGLAPSTLYYYWFYSENWSYYSASHATANATTLAGGQTITVDGNPADWNGSASTVINNSASSLQQFIWTDKTGEVRPEQPANGDISEFRVFADADWVYFLVKMVGIADATKPYVAIGVDTRMNTGSTALNWLGDDSGIGLGAGYFLSAAEHFPEAQVIVHYVNAVSGDRIEMNRVGVNGWHKPPTGDDTNVVISAAYGAIELKVPRADLGLTGTKTARFTIASFLNSGAWNNDADGTAQIAVNTPDAVDSVSIAPILTEDNAADLSAWLEDISSANIDFWHDVKFGTSSLIDNSRPSTPVLVTPTNTAATTASPNLTWNASTDGDGQITSYLLEISTNSQFNGVSGTENGTVDFRMSLPATATSYKYTTSATQYWWRVRARDTAGELSLATTRQFRVVGKLDSEGPQPTLVYIGTNVTGYLAGQYDEQIERYGYIQSVRDTEIKNAANVFGFVIRWDDASGVYATNRMKAADSPPNGEGGFAWNIVSGDGRVSPNWDLFQTNTTSGAISEWGKDAVFFATNTKATGNSNLTMTNYVHAAFSMAAYDPTIEYYLTLSAEDAYTTDGSWLSYGSWNSFQSLTTAVYSGWCDDGPNSVRNITTNFLIRIQVTDDDIMPPTPSTALAWANEASLVISNSAGALTRVEGQGRDVLYQATDGDLVAGSSLSFNFNVYDPFYKGIAIGTSSTFTDNARTQTNTAFVVDGWQTNWANYNASMSVASDTRNDNTRLTWNWNPLTTNDITSLWGSSNLSGGTGETSYIRLDLRDMDNDRPSDQSANLATFGRLRVVDDDPISPVLGTNNAVQVGTGPYTAVTKTNGETEVVLTAWSFTNNVSVAEASKPWPGSLVTNAVITRDPRYTPDLVALGGGANVNDLFGIYDQVARGELYMGSIGTYFGQTDVPWIQFELNLVSAREQILSWAEAGGNDGFSTARMKWSANGIDFTADPLWPVWNPNTGGASIFASRFLEFTGVIPAGLAKVYLRIELGPGFGGGGGTYRMDNIQLTGYPEEYIITDGQLATSGSKLQFQGNLYDAYSGLNEAGSSMTVGSAMATRVDGKKEGDGQIASTKLWWELSMDTNQITDAIVTSGSGSGLPIGVNIADNDNDRAGDAITLLGQFGQLRVKDDDVDRPLMVLTSMRPNGGIVAQWNFSNMLSRLPTARDADVTVTELGARTLAGTVSTPNFVTNAASGGYAVRQSGWHRTNKFWCATLTPQSAIAITNISFQSRLSTTNGPTGYRLQKFANNVLEETVTIYFTGGLIDTSVWYQSSHAVNFTLEADESTEIRLRAYGCNPNYIGAQWAIYNLSFLYGISDTNGVTEVTDEDFANGSMYLEGQTWDADSGIVSTNNANTSKRPMFSLRKPDGVSLVSNQVLRFSNSVPDGGATSEAASGFINEVVQANYTNLMTGSYQGEASVWDFDNDRSTDDLRMSGSVALYVVDNDVTPPGTVGAVRVNGNLVPGSAPNRTTAPWTNRAEFMVGFDSVAKDVAGEGSLPVKQQAATGIGEYRVTADAAVGTMSASNRAYQGTPYPVAATNGALANYGFEMTAANSGWTFVSGCSYQTLVNDPTKVREGTNSLMQSSGGEAYQLIEFGNVDGTTPTVGVSGWYQSTEGATFKVEAFHTTTNLTTPIGTTGTLTLPVANAWTAFTLPVQTVGNSTTTVLKITLKDNGGNTTYWDALRLSVNIGTNLATMRYVATSQGVTTNYVFAVDVDNNRPGDRLAGTTKPFYVAYDATPPTLVPTVSAVNDQVDDPSSQFDLRWVGTDIGPDDPLSPKHPTGDPGAKDILSPWQTYKVYYGPYDPMSPEGGSSTAIYDNFVKDGQYKTNAGWAAITSTNAIADPGAPSYQPNYSALTDPARTNIRLYDLEYDKDYVVVVVGVDKAGNEGPANGGSWSTNNTIKFAVTQGLMRARAAVESAFSTNNNLQPGDKGAAALYWIAAGQTNMQGTYTNVTKDYDLIYWDNATFQESSNTTWSKVGTAKSNWFADARGQDNPPRGNVRFYRASYKDRWQRTNVLSNLPQRPLASEDVYAMHSVLLSEGYNYVALHGQPYINSFAGVFGTDTSFWPASMTPSLATRVQFFSAGVNAPVESTYFFGVDAGTPGWYRDGSTPVNETDVQQEDEFFMRGFAIILPELGAYQTTTGTDVLTSNAVPVPAMMWHPVLKVPTNGPDGGASFSHTIHCGQINYPNPPDLIYNVVALNLPVAVHPSQMGLTNNPNTFRKGTRGFGDEIYTLNTSTKGVLSGSTIYCDPSGVWRFVSSNGGVPWEYFKPNDVIVIVSRNGGLNNTWTWTYSPADFYNMPTRWMGQ